MKVEGRKIRGTKPGDDRGWDRGSGSNSGRIEAGVFRLTTVDS